MKVLVLVRHAKSSWSVPGQNDFDRPLNDRGKADAPEMARRVKEYNAQPDLIVSSPAKRAKRTARYFAEEFDIKKDDIILVDDLYLATEEAFRNAITSQSDKAEVVFLFAHNPGITTFASSLTNVHVDEMPTCGVFAVQAETDSWKDFMQSEKKFLFFDYPRRLQDK